MSRRASLVLAAVLTLATSILLVLGHRQVGYARDEGIYFEASRRYGAWVDAVVQQPARLGDRALRDRTFAFNHEHPPFMKIAAGVSARWLARPPAAGPASAGTAAWPWLAEGAAMRLPAQLLAAFGAGLLAFAAARRFGGLAGVLAAAGCFALPRVWFHAGLHAFDVPVAVATLVVALAYLRALRDPRWGWVLGIALGWAIAVKHNALFLLPCLALHACLALLRRRRRGAAVARGAWVSWPLLAMGTSSPLVALGLWPWLWSDPPGRLARYLAFHRHHHWYNTEFLGLNHNQPPMPFGYPWVMTWATVPTVLLLLVVLGAVWPSPALTPASASRSSFWRPVPDLDATDERLLWVILALFPLLLIAWPSTPIFGGTKHWITAYPFFALLAARGWSQLVRTAAIAGPLRALTVVVVLVPGIWSTLRAHPLGLSQYAPLVGGARGAAALGLQRGFWGHATLPLVEDLDGPLYPHDLHPLAKLQYERDGTWPPGLELVPLDRARSALHFYERHMLADEVRAWNRAGTTRPDAVLELDDVPIGSRYRVPEPR